MRDLQGKGSRKRKLLAKGVWIELWSGRHTEKKRIGIDDLELKAGVLLL